MSKALEIEHKSFLDALSYQSLLSFKLDGRQHPVPNMLTDRVVEHLDIIEHVLPGLFACFIGASPDALARERREEALGDSIIMAVSPAAHGVFQIVSPDECSLVHAAELRALVGMDEHAGLRLTHGFPPIMRSRSGRRRKQLASDCEFDRRNVAGYDRRGAFNLEAARCCMHRESGEGVAVSTRGVEPDLNRVEANGVYLLGNSGSGQRRVDFRELGSERRVRGAGHLAEICMG